MEAHQKIEVRNPRNGKSDYSFQSINAPSLKKLCEDSKDRHTNFWSKTTIDDRIKILLKWKSELILKKDDIVAALVQDTGRLIESKLEFDVMVQSIDRWCEEGKNLFNDQTEKTSSIPFISYKQDFLPFGLVGVISPWNFPLLLAHIDAIPALVAGSCVIIKPSEFAPRFVDPLIDSLKNISELEHVVNYIKGDGIAGAELIENVDMLCFTGSVATGEKVASLAAKHFIPVSLELGGKDAAVVFNSANIERASSALVWASVVNSGQSCLSIERVYAHREIHDELLNQIVDKAQKVSFCYPDIEKGDIGPIISPNQSEIIINHISDAVQKGATLHCGGSLENHGGGDWVAPTVLSHVTHDMLVMKEETFGPVIPVMGFDSIEDALHLMNDTKYGLSGSVFGSVDIAENVAKQMQAGAISINDAGLTAMLRDGEKQSFKKSGIGETRMGRSSMLRFLRKKALYFNHNEDSDPWWFN